ncbi:MAG: hypothetical protein COA58_16545 [Bacteroidetes bacterium]|nr:MAG: hypothetical protein COA58_16545 [Bacteroidota bacterium]
MQIQKNNLSLKDMGRHLFQAGAFLFLISWGAKIDFDLGGLVSFTLQTLFLGLAYYYLPFGWRLGLVTVYLLLGILGIPVFNGGAGWDYFSSWPLGFFMGFVLSVFVTKSSKSNFYAFLSFFFRVHMIILLSGIVWIGVYADSFTRALETCVELLPGAIIKSLVGAAIVWVVEKKLVLKTKGIKR